MLLLTTLFISFLLNLSDSFSAIHYQQYSRGMNFILIKYSFSGDCFFVFKLSAFLIVVMKKQKGVQMFFIALFTFMMTQVLENGSLLQSVILHFKVWQNIYPGKAETGHHLISFNTAVVLTLCAVSAKYTNNRRTHLFLLIAVLLMAFTEFILCRKAFGISCWRCRFLWPLSLQQIY